VRALLTELTALDVQTLKAQLEAKLGAFNLPPQPASSDDTDGSEVSSSRGTDDSEEDVVKRLWDDVTRAAVMLLPARWRGRFGGQPSQDSDAESDSLD
jgi:hypothetical protein